MHQKNRERIKNVYEIRILSTSVCDIKDILKRIIKDRIRRDNDA